MSDRAAFTVFGFETTHDAIRAEAALEAAGIAAVLIPTPRALGALCGLAARVPRHAATDAERALEAADVRVSATVELEDRTGV